MRLVTSLIALAIAIGAVVLPGAVGHQAAVAADAPQVTVTFAAANSGTLAPGEPLVLNGIISNSTRSAIPAGVATVYLGRSPISTRAEFTGWLTPSTETATEKRGGPVLDSPIPEIPAGHTANLQLTVPPESIDFGSQSTIWGARTLAVSIVAGGSAVGESRSSIVWNSGAPVEQTKLALAMPITVPASSDGLIPTDLLASYTSQGGLLSRELNDVLGMNVAIGVDPRILASIRILGPSAPASAIAWLARLEAATNDKFVLSYADSDLAAVSQAKTAGTSERVLAPTSFPVNASLFPGASTATPTPTGPGPTPTGSPVDTIPDAQSLQALNHSIDAVAWPADDSVVETDLDNFATAGFSTTILSSSNVGYGGIAYTPGAAASIGTHEALISDSAISSYLRAADSAPTAVEWARAISNLSTAVSIVSKERPTDSRTILATFGRTSPGADFRTAETLAALGTLPWLGAASLSNITAAFGPTPSAAPVAATLVPKAESADRLATVSGLMDSELTAGSFASALVDPTAITGERRLSLLALLANSWTADDSWAAATKKYTTKSSKLTNSISIAKSSSVLITATSTSLPVTVTNTLPWPVTVYVSARSPTGILTISNDRVELTVEAESQAKAAVPVESLANGNGVVDVRLSSATNVPIGGVDRIDVDVQAGWETAFTALVAVLLFGVFGFGIYRNIAKRRKARRSRIEDDSEPSTSEATEISGATEAPERPVSTETTESPSA